MDLRGLNGRRARLLTAAAAVVLALVLAPAALAWFSLRLSSADNWLSSGEAAGIQLWAQTADGRLSGDFLPLDGASFSGAGRGDAGPVWEDGACCPGKGRLYLLSGGTREAASEASPGAGLFCDSGLLPGDTVSRRLIVRNGGGEPTSYLLAFSGGGTDSLGEALRVELTRRPGDSSAGAETFPPMDANQLLARTFEGELEPGGFDVYELHVTFLESAGDWYEGRTFQLGVQARASTGGTVHPVQNGAELLAVLDGPLEHGDTIAVLDDVEVERFTLDRIVNLEIAGGKSLTVRGRFAMVVPAGEDGRDPFGTADIAYGEENGRLVLDGCEILLDAPRVAFRWNRESVPPPPECCRIRSLNGERYGGSP